MEFQTTQNHVQQKKMHCSLICMSNIVPLFVDLSKVTFWISLFIRLSFMHLSTHAIVQVFCICFLVRSCFQEELINILNVVTCRNPSNIQNKCWLKITRYNNKVNKLIQMHGTTFICWTRCWCSIRKISKCDAMSGFVLLNSFLFFLSHCSLFRNPSISPCK